MVCKLKWMPNIYEKIFMVNCYKGEVYEIGTRPREMTFSRLESNRSVL